jgi:deoxyribonuclease V
MPHLLPEIPDLARCLRELLAQVPAGRVTTYGALAEALGNPIAARWVGHFAMHHRHGPECACHRIVRVDGQIGLFIGGPCRAKARRLAAEGVPAPDGAVDLRQFGFDRFVGDRPLDRLKRVQETLRRRVAIRARKRLPRHVGGVDVAYPGQEEGVAAYALVETATGRLTWSTTIRRPVRFPYVTSYLTFRELPLLVALIEEVRRQGKLAEVVLVDGSGILHPRHAGIACHFGVVASLATIGVTKKLLCGKVDISDMAARESRPVVLDGDLTGVALRPTSGSRRPIFVSPGHRVDVAFCERTVRQLLTGRRLPEPLYWADRLGRAAGSDRPAEG